MNDESEFLRSGTVYIGSGPPQQIVPGGPNIHPNDKLYEGNSITVDVGPTDFEIRATALMAASNSSPGCVVEDLLLRAKRMELYLRGEDD